VADVIVTTVKTITPSFTTPGAKLRFNFAVNGKSTQISYTPPGDSQAIICPSFDLDDVVGLSQGQLNTAMVLIVEHALTLYKTQQEA